MIKYQEFIGSSRVGNSDLAREFAMGSLNCWLKEFNVKIIGMQWRYTGGTNGRSKIVKIEIMYREVTR